MKPIKSKLPKKLSTVLRHAMVDFKATQKLPAYYINMGAWHMPKILGPGVCTVCLAGTVLANTFGIPIKEHVSPGSLLSEYRISKEDYARLRALNDLRCGNIKLACGRLRRMLPEKCPITVPVTGYETDPKKWAKDMRRVLHTLEKHGL